MKRKATLIILSFVCALLCAFGLAACDEKHEHTYSGDWAKNDTHHWHAATCEHTDEKSDYAEHDFSQSNTCVCGYKKVTANELFDVYKTQTRNFANGILDKVSVGANATSAGYNIVTDGDRVTGADIIVVNQTENVFGESIDGKVLLISVTFTMPVSAADIANGTAAEVNFQTDKTEVFEFDAKENLDNQAIVNALYKANEISSNLKLISEAETTDESSVVYNYVTVNGNDIKVYQTEIEKGNGSSEAIIKNLNNGLYSAPAELATYTIKGTNLQSVGYTYEDVELTCKFNYKKTADGYALTGIRDETITELEIPEAIASITENAFDGCSDLQSITVDENNANYSSKDGILYNKAQTAFIHIPLNLSGNVVVSDGITSIAYNAFSGRTGLTGITIPDGVTSIGNYAFNGCGGLTEIKYNATACADLSNCKQSIWAHKNKSI